MIDVKIKGGVLCDEEIEAYKKHIKDKTGRAYDHIKEITMTVDGEYVNLEWRFYDIPFDRIRRITGYLVGTLDRFNDGKRAEESERVKHTV